MRNVFNTSAHDEARIARELEAHNKRECPSCGGEYPRSDGRVPSAPGYVLDHCPTCRWEIEQRAVRAENRRLS